MSWIERDSLGFLGYKYEKSKHFALPILPDGGPSQLIDGENLYHDNLVMRTFPGCESMFRGKTLAYTSGGTHEVIAGDTLTGATSGATCLVESVVLTSGTWAGGDAAGYFYITDVVGTFQSENLDEGANPNVCTISTQPADIQLGSSGKRTCLGIFPYTASDGTIYLVLVYPDKIYSYNAGDDTPVEIHGSVTMTGTNTNPYDSEYFADTTSGYDPWIILTNGIDPPIKWTGTGNCATLGGTPPEGKYITAFNSHLFISNVESGGVDYTQRDYRSDVDEAEDWSAGLSGPTDLRQSAGNIQGSVVFGDVRYIFKENGVSICRATGYDPPFAYDEDELPIGLLAPKTLIKILKYDYAFFLGQDQNVYLLRKDGGYIAIGDAIQDQIKEWANASYVKYSFAVYHPGLDQIILGVPSDDTANYCQRLFLFDVGHYIKSGQVMWSTPINTGINFTAGSPARFREPYTIGDLGDVSSDGTIGGIAGNIGDLFQDASYNEVAMADNNGKVFRFDAGIDNWNGTTVSWSAVMKDAHLSGKQSDHFRFLEYELLYRNPTTVLATCTAQVSVDGGGSYAESETLTLYDSTGAEDEELEVSGYFDTVGKIHRVKLSGTYHVKLIGQRWLGAIEGRW